MFSSVIVSPRQWFFLDERKRRHKRRQLLLAIATANSVTSVFTVAGSPIADRQLGMT
jgi:hypothetical protein